MKNYLINEIMNSNLFAAETSVIDDPKDAYRALKWKTKIPEAFKSVREQWDNLLKECFSEEELGTLNNPEAEKTEELNQKLDNFNKLFSELMADETEVSIKPISFESWHRMLNKSNIKLGMLEPLLEGELFESPEE